MLPKLLKIWLVVAAFIDLSDAIYILNMPNTLPGGKYQGFWLYKYYAIYSYYDQAYSHQSSFLTYIACTDIPQGLGYILALSLSLSKNPKTLLYCGLIAIIASTMNFWQVIGALVTFYPQAATAVKEFTLGAIINFYCIYGAFLIFPLAVIIIVSKNIVKQNRKDYIEN